VNRGPRTAHYRLAPLITVSYTQLCQGGVCIQADSNISSALGPGIFVDQLVINHRKILKGLKSILVPGQGIARCYNQANRANQRNRPHLAFSFRPALKGLATALSLPLLYSRAHCHPLLFAQHGSYRAHRNPVFPNRSPGSSLARWDVRVRFGGFFQEAPRTARYLGVILSFRKNALPRLKASKSQGAR